MELNKARGKKKKWAAKLRAAKRRRRESGCVGEHGDDVRPATEHDGDDVRPATEHDDDVRPATEHDDDDVSVHDDDDAAANHDDDETTAGEENNTVRHQRKLVVPLRWRLTEVETGRVDAMKKRYREIRAKIRAELRPIMQPGGSKHGHCLVVSVLNCLEDDVERRQFLRLEKQPESWRDPSAYQVYMAYCKRQLGNGGPYHPDGMRVWLEHLREIGVIRSFVWRRWQALEKGIAGFFGPAVRERPGATMVICGYHGRSEAKGEAFEHRIWKSAATRELWTANVAAGEEETKALAERCWRAVVDHWTAKGWNGQVPVQGYHGRDPRDLDAEAMTRTLIPAVMEEDGSWRVLNEEPCHSVGEWRTVTGRTQRSFDDEYHWNRWCIGEEKKETLGNELYLRDSTRMPKLNNDGKDSGVVTAPEPTGEWLLALLKRAEPPVFERKGKKKGSPVSRHAVAGKVTGHGDVVLLDPGLRTTHVVSRLDLAESVSGILSCFIEHWAVYEFQVTFGQSNAKAVSP